MPDATRRPARHDRAALRLLIWIKPNHVAHVLHSEGRHGPPCRKVLAARPDSLARSMTGPLPPSGAAALLSGGCLVQTLTSMGGDMRLVFGKLVIAHRR